MGGTISTEVSVGINGCLVRSYCTETVFDTYMSVIGFVIKFSHNLKINQPITDTIGMH